MKHFLLDVIEMTIHAVGIAAVMATIYVAACLLIAL
jgi:hypothetical protein